MSSTFSGMPEVVHETATYDQVDGTYYGADATFKRASLFIIGEENERPEAQFAVYNVFEPNGEQVHQQRLVINDDCSDAWIDAYPEALRHIAEWLFRQASELIPDESGDLV